MNEQESLFQYLLRLADDRLIIGHRLSEWCGHAPILEEDIALANIALDCIGHATHLLQLAGEVEGKGRSEDDLAYFRSEREFRNVKLAEQPNGDFAHTIVRQFLFDAYSFLLYDELQKSSDERLAAVAAKTLKEIRYHLRHTGEWVLRLGDGTEESHQRAQEALDSLWTFTGELFEQDEIDELLSKDGIAPNLSELKPRWEKIVRETIEKATLTVPDPDQYMATGARAGIHSEHLGHLLAEMQIVPRSYPDAKWN